MEQIGVVLFDNGKGVPIPRGIKNKGNRCWLLAIIQMLLGLPSFNEYIKKNESHFIDGTLERAYLQIYNNYVNKLISIDVLTGSVLKFQDLIVAKDESIEKPFRKKGIQQCALEGFQKIIELFLDEGIHLKSNVFGQKRQGVCVCNVCKRTNISYDSELSSETVLEFPKESTNDGIPVTRSESVNEMETRIKSFADELFDGDISCKICHNPVGKQTKFDILIKTNNVIIITIKRFYQNVTTAEKFKIKEVANYPFDIEFFNGYNKIQYKLVGVVSHNGKSVDFGHYVTHSYRLGKWYLLDDDAVTEQTPVRDDNVFTSYILAYHISSITKI